MGWHSPFKYLHKEVRYSTLTVLSSLPLTTMSFVVKAVERTVLLTNKQKNVRILVVYDQLTGLAGHPQIVKDGKHTWTEQFSMKCWKTIYIVLSFVLLSSVIGLKTFTLLSRPIRGPTKFSRTFEIWLGKQGWRSGESTRLLPICSPGSIPGPGVICGLSLLLILVLARVLWFSPLLKNQHLQIPIRLGICGPLRFVSRYRLLSVTLVKQSLLLFYLLRYLRLL